MKKALRLAAKGQGRTSPNPLVGAVVVREDTIVGEGYHEHVGGPHAEINALRKAGDHVKGASLYVTLEPCTHHGRTPPCVSAIIDAGVSHVVIGMRDPNPHVSGGGVEVLRGRGIDVEVGILEKECRLLNQAFIKHTTTGIPLVTVKAAATLDGHIAARTGDSRWISNERSRRFVHRLRCAVDGILVGIGTALADDPRLTARLPKNPPCRQPIRIVLDTYSRIPLDSQLVRTAGEVPTWIICGENSSQDKENKMKEASVTVLRLPTKEDQIDLTNLLKELGKRQLSHLLVEGGARVLGALLEERLADEFYFFYAPKILGDPQGIPMVQGRSRERMSEALRVYDLRIRRFGEDVMFKGRFRESEY
jgi:diaminohydroxyphosphoribosylaminopyrimidine deaminase/5-amino-6-(5-phosphoribosylamino)uracil reductase